MATTDGTKVTGTGIAVAIAVVIALAFLFFGSSVIELFGGSNSAAGIESVSDENGEATTSTNGAFMKEDVVMGTGAEAVAGKSVTVNYVGKLTDGQVFDASTNHGQPFTFDLGAGQVIAGWDQGLVGMKVGGKRILTIPPEMGYGAQAVGPIPANSTLIFEVELLDVK